MSETVGEIFIILFMMGLFPLTMSAIGLTTRSDLSIFGKIVIFLWVILILGVGIGLGSNVLIGRLRKLIKEKEE